MAQAPSTAVTQSAGSWLDYVPGSYYFRSAPPASMAEFAVSLNAGVTAFKAGMTQFKQVDENLSVSQIKTSYVYKSVADDIGASFRFSNLNTNPSEHIRLSMPMAKDVKYSAINPKVYKTLFDYVCRYNKETKGSSLHIKNADEVTDYSRINVVFKSNISLTTDNSTLESSLVQFGKTAEQVKSVVQSILKGNEPPRFPEDIGEFILMADIEGAKKKMAEKGESTKDSTHVAANLPSIGITAEILNAKRNGVEDEIAKMPLSKFKQQYSFKLVELNAVTVTYNTEFKGVYQVNKPLTLRTPGRVDQRFIKGIQEYSKTTVVPEKGVIVLKLNTEDKMFTLLARVSLFVKLTPEELDKALNNFCNGVMGIRVTTRLFG